VRRRFERISKAKNTRNILMEDNNCIGKEYYIDPNTGKKVNKQGTIEI
jgi:hypothetical protein